MFCKNCGEPLGENQVVCLKCGVERGNGKGFCENCGTAIPENAEFCLSCGAKKSRKKSTNKNSSSKTVNGVISILLGVIGIFLNLLLYTDFALILGIVGIILSTVWRLEESVKKHCTVGLVLSIIAMSIAMLVIILTKYFDMFKIWDLF